jgi:hypothetical protein
VDGQPGLTHHLVRVKRAVTARAERCPCAVCAVCPTAVCVTLSPPLPPSHAACRDHFWLNEGWTRFVETKIMERHEGKAIAHMKVSPGGHARTQGHAHVKIGADGR